MTEARAYRAGLLTVVRSSLERDYPQLPALVADLDPERVEEHAYSDEDLYQLAERLSGRKITRKPASSLEAIGALLSVVFATVATGYETAGADGAHAALARVLAELDGQPPEIVGPGPRQRLSVLAGES